jgi:hypothetical protein
MGDVYIGYCCMWYMFFLAMPVAHYSCTLDV